MTLPIHQLITKPEGKTLEFKRDLSSPKNMLKTLTKFAKQPRRQPFVVAIRSTSEQLETEKERLWVTARFVKGGIPVFKTVERACRALYKYTGYYRRLAENEIA